MAKILVKKAKSFNDWAYLAIDKHTHKFIKHEAGVLEDKDPEELHQMRVGMRKLRSAIVGFSSALNLPKSAQKKEIGKIARILGQLRDLDVLLEIIEQKYLPDLPEAEKSKLNQVVKHIKRTRKKIFKLVKFTLKSNKYQKLKKSLFLWLDKPKFLTSDAIQIEDILSDLLSSSINNFLSHPGWQVGIKEKENPDKIPEHLTPEKVEEILEKQGFIVHDLRKEAKRCRYQMELFTQFYGDLYQEYLREVKNLQTVLGDLQDDAVFQELLIQTIPKDFPEKMPVLCQKIQDDRFEQWQKWQELQAKFIQNSTQEEFRQVINNHQ